MTRTRGARRRREQYKAIWRRYGALDVCKCVHMVSGGEERSSTNLRNCAIPCRAFLSLLAPSPPVVQSQYIALYCYACGGIPSRQWGRCPQRRPVVTVVRHGQEQLASGCISTCAKGRKPTRGVAWIAVPCESEGEAPSWHARNVGQVVAAPVARTGDNKHEIPCV